ncbi:hypothetical protein [Streptomyces atroolivaceus]|uniref:hypothetical protein n=1 Tax=Streptomyces atroolivaceus TaxID=66869 RepID=UPI0036790CDA
MAYFTYDSTGEEHPEPGEARIRRIVARLGDADEEHPDFSLQHGSGWSLSIFPSCPCLGARTSGDAPF